MKAGGASRSSASQFFIYKSKPKNYKGTTKHKTKINRVKNSKGVKKKYFKFFKSKYISKYTCFSLL
jgi:hypothetical protein